MSVKDGQRVNQEVTNAAFVSKKTDSTVISKLTLSRALSGATIDDVQEKINELNGRTSDIESDYVTLNDPQEINNKIYNGGTATEQSAFIVPKAALSVLQGLTRKKGAIYYDTDSDIMFYDDGISLSPMGGGGSGLFGDDKQWYAPQGNGAVVEEFQGLQCFGFYKYANNKVSKIVKVSPDYNGEQLKLAIYVSFEALALKTYKFKLKSTLFISTTFGFNNSTYIHEHELTEAVAYTTPDIRIYRLEFEVTDVNGQMSGGSVVPNALIKLELERTNISTESNDLVEPVYLLT